MYILIFIGTYYSISSYKVNSVASLGHQAPSFGRVFLGCRLVAVRKMSESATVCWFVVSKRLKILRLQYPSLWRVLNDMVVDALHQVCFSVENVCSLSPTPCVQK